MIARLLIMLTAVSAVLAGCADADPSTAEGVTRAVVNTEAGIELQTRVETDEIVLADRIWVEDLASWSDGLPPVFEPRDWDATEWTVIEEIGSPAMTVDGKLLIQRRTLIEPFLPGSYSIPGSVVRITAGSELDPLLMRTEPIGVQVTGVLADDDTGELNAIPDVTAPSAESPEDNTPMLIAVAVATVLVLSAVIVALRSNGQTPSSRSALELLREIQRDPSLDARDGFERLGRVFDRLDPRLRSTSEFEQMIHVCDQSRYGRSAEPSHRVTPQKMAGHALELLGDDSETILHGGKA
jgi:hypothetical protein